MGGVLDACCALVELLPEHCVSLRRKLVDSSAAASRRKGMWLLSLTASSGQGKGTDSVPSMVLHI
jgi:hypothetical protein